MLSPLRRSLPLFGRRWKPLDFSNQSFVRIPEYHKIEEEALPDYVASIYYPRRIGEVIKERYQVVGKFGFGSTSTHRYIMLKIFVQASLFGRHDDNELRLYQHIEQCPEGHRRREAIRVLLDTFDIEGPTDTHHTLTFLHRNPMERLPSAVLAMVLWRVLLKLDYLHTQCEVARTDIKTDNIMLGIDNDSVFSEFEEKELEHPVPRKEVGPDGRIIYVSRDLKLPKNIARPVLCDFGSAMIAKEYQTEFVQPNIYQAPEVIIGVPWAYSVDIWNIWHIYEGGSLFTGHDHEFQRYRSRAHLAEIINLLGSPPPTLLVKGELREKFFTVEGEFGDAHLLTDRVPLEKRETTLAGQEEREAFLRLMEKMLQWEPHERSSAKELAEGE
ncbi:kinase-like protein [Aspergillus pseudoustus]|uniref:non-specific serine/threonine protein kinase n=1 Tax=Aspergillus pseudoustus TaxID=1810923 RepID=A0ABR4ILT7_9EURO